MLRAQTTLAYLGILLCSPHGASRVYADQPGASPVPTTGASPNAAVSPASVQPGGELPPSGKPLMVVGGVVTGASLAYMGLLALASSFCCEGPTCLGSTGSCEVNYLLPAAAGVGGLALMIAGSNMESTRREAIRSRGPATALVPTLSATGAGVACVGRF